METQAFTTVHLRNLSLDNLYAITQSTIAYAKPVITGLGGVTEATLNQLEVDNNAMGEQINKALKSGLTPQITTKDEERDDRNSEINRNVTMHLKGRDEAKKAAAENLKLFLEPYWDLNDKPLNTQTSMLNDLFAKYNANEALKADATTIGIAGLMTGLETCNTEFNTLYQSRNTQDAADGPTASSLKAAVVKSYYQFCTAIEQAANFTPSDNLNTLFNQIDELRKTYARYGTATPVAEEDDQSGPTQPS